MHKIKADMDKVKEFFEKTLPGAVAAGTATALPEADPGHVRQEAHALRAAGHITAEENAHIQATLMAMAHEAGRHELVDAACEASAEARQLASKGLLTEEELLEIERKQQEAEQAFLRDEFPETAPAAGDEDPFSAETDTFEVLPVMEDSDDDDFTSNSPEEDDKESAVEAFPLLDDPSHSVTAWKATHRCPVTDFFGKPKVRYYIPKGAEIHSIGHVVCPKTHRLWIKFLSDDGFEEWAAATSSTGQQMLLQPVDREFRFRSRNHRVQKVYEFVSKPHEHHIITNASVKLQALFRRKKSEKHLIEEQRRQAAAIELQRAFRKTKQAAARRNTWAAAPGSVEVVNLDQKISDEALDNPVRARRRSSVATAHPTAVMTADGSVEGVLVKHNRSGKGKHKRWFSLCDSHASSHVAVMRWGKDAHHARKRKQSESFAITRETTLTSVDSDESTARQDKTMMFRLGTPGSGELVVEALHPLDMSLWTDSIRKLIQAKVAAHEETLRQANPALMF